MLVRFLRLILATLVVFLAACRHPPPKAVVDNPVIVEEIRFEGFDVLPVPIFDRFRTDFSIRRGDALTTEREQRAGTRAVEVLQENGYPYAQIAIAREPLGAERIRLFVRAQPGTRGIFGRVDIAGNRRVDDAIIRRRIAYAPGDLFRRSAIERTQQRIGALGLFKSVEIRAQNVDLQPAEVPTLVTVVEQNPWQWNVSLGYAAAERLGVDARISNLNFYGSARRLDIEGRVSKIERAGGISLTQTDTWHPSFSWSLQARYREVDEEPSYLVQSRGGQGSATWQWTPELASTFSYAVANERSDVNPALEPLIGLQDGMLSAWSIDLGRQSPALPFPGPRSAADVLPSTSALTLHVEQAGGWMPGTFNYFNVIGDARFYRITLRDQLTFAGRVRYGAIDPMAIEADIPLLKRFFLGGADEMRGWSIYEVSPLSQSGVPVGGKSLLSLTGEVRFPIFRRLKGALFAEAGNVWQPPWTIDFDNLLYDAGSGLRFASPYGLIRVDFGYQLKTLEGLRIDGLPQKHRWRIAFGIGEAF